jgi:hypothetical protein
MRSGVEKHQAFGCEAAIDVRLSDGKITLQARSHRNGYRTLGMLVERIRKMPILLAQAASEDDHG